MEQKKEKRTKAIIFWTRFFIYIVFGLVIPISFLIWRFDLFSSTNKIKFGGWGILAIILMAIFMINLSKQTEECFENGIEKQIIRAIRKVFIPLLSVTLCLWAVSDFINELIQFFIVITMCETIASMVNPMFDLAKEHKEGRIENKMIKMAKIFWSNKE